MSLRVGPREHRAPRVQPPLAAARSASPAAVPEIAVRKRRREKAAPPSAPSVSVRSQSPAWLSPLAPKDQPITAISGAICHCAPGEAEADARAGASARAAAPAAGLAGA